MEYDGKGEYQQDNPTGQKEPTGIDEVRINNIAVHDRCS
jgi:hypothetical protein